MVSRKFNIPFSSVGTLPFPLFLKMIFSSKVYPRYYLKCLVAGIISLLSEPFRWLELLMYAKKLDQTILPDSPVFILGHWRSGTTLLHNVMAQDKQFAFINTFQSVFANQFFASRWLFKPLMRLVMPNKRPADNVLLSPELPQEEGVALANVNSFGFYHFFYFPKDWKQFYKKYISGEIASSSSLELYRKRYKRLIAQAMREYKRSGFISKFPPNTGSIKQLLHMFPNAKFIYIYRNPLDAFRSTVHFFETTHDALKLQPFTRTEIEEMVFELYEMIIRDYESLKTLISPGHLVEIKYEDFEKEPIVGLKEIYETLNLSGFEDSKTAFEAYLESQKRFEKATRKSDPVLEERIAQRLGFAMELYGYNHPLA